MSITRTCNGCGEAIPAEQAGALVVQRDANPGMLRAPGLAALARTDWCCRCAAPILAVVGESLTRARQARQRRAMQDRARSLDLSDLGDVPGLKDARHPDLDARQGIKNLRRNRHLRLTT